MQQNGAAFLQIGLCVTERQIGNVLQDFFVFLLVFQLELQVPFMASMLSGQGQCILQGHLPADSYGGVHVKVQFAVFGLKINFFLHWEKLITFLVAKCVY